MVVMKVALMGLNEVDQTAGLTETQVVELWVE
jgi:hypothetical protein